MEIMLFLAGAVALGIIAGAAVVAATFAAAKATIAYMGRRTS